MRTHILFLAFFLLLSPLAGAAEGPRSDRGDARAFDSVEVETMTALDNNLLLAVYADVEPRKNAPLKFAEPRDAYLGTTNAGTWEDLDDGSRLWRLRIVSPGAVSINLGLERFDLPPGAKMWLYGPTRDVVQGPYTGADRNADGGLWTALVPGEEMILEVHVPAEAVDAGKNADVLVHRVNHAFREFGAQRPQGFQEKQGNCQNDVVCPEGNAWRKQIRSVAWYSVQGEGACTGQLVNNTARDGKPYFLSAEHCGVTRNNASSMVVYWNDESPSCGRLGGGSIAHNQSGAIFRAAHRPSDFLLVELNRKPETRFNVYYSGWNARNQAPAGAVGIHHPNLDEKSISFSNRPLRPAGSTHWEIVWNDGTTEPGSSGSCIFDDQGLCVGTLTGGSSYCWDPQGPDEYGRMSRHFTGGGGRANSLRSWLDPTGSGRMTLAGMNPNGSGGGGNGGGGNGGGGNGGGNGGGGNGGGSCQADENTVCLHDGRFEVSLNWASKNRQGKADVMEKTGQSAVFSFSGNAQWDMLVKVVDQCSNANRWSVQAAGNTNLEYTLKVKDLRTGDTKNYRNAYGNVAKAVIDRRTFKDCR